MNDDAIDPEDVLLNEILEQPAAMRSAGRGLVDQIDALAALRAAAESSPGPLILTGMGSSFDALTSLASALGGHGIPALALHAAELVRFRSALTGGGSLVLAVSQSGMSAELVRLATMYSGGRGTLASVTNGLDNPLSESSSIRMDMRAGHEIGPATKTYASSTVVLSAIAQVLTGVSPRPAASAAHDAALAAAAAAEPLLAEHRRLASDMTRWLGERSSLALVGRGRATGAADVGALVLKEAAHLPAWSMDAAEFRHGPLELAGPDLAVIVVGLEATTLDLDRRLLDDVASRGGAVMSIGRSAEGSGHHHVALPAVDPLIDTGLAAMPVQLLAWSLAHLRNPHPGRFVAGSKVTTQE